MKRIRRGFTLVEVALFLAITAAVFVGIAVGTQNSIFQQRYNDSVQNFAEFLRSVYSQVTNVQSEGTGRSGYAIYGKLVTFGKSEDGNENVITTYNVIGEVEEEASAECRNKNYILDRLACLKLKVMYKGKPVGLVESYKPRWASQIQTTAAWEDNEYKLYEGTLLIVRSPSSGTVYTYVTDDDVNVESDESILDGVEFKMQEVDFCVNPNGADRSTLRRDVRIAKGARNASGIEILPDGEGCQ